MPLIVTTARVLRQIAREADALGEARPTCYHRWTPQALAFW